MDFDLSSVPDDFSAYSLDELDALKAQAFAATAPIREKATGTHDADDLATLRTLRNIVAGADAERTAREEAAANAEADAAEAETLLAELDDTEADADESDGDTDAEGESDDAATAESKEVVTASARTRPRVRDVAPTAPRPRKVETNTPENFARLVTGADASANSYANWFDVAKEAERRLSTYKGLRGEGRHSIATIKREFSADLISAGDEDDRLVNHAIDQKRLPGNSLVAAAGWCAPSQTVYDLCELETTDGLWDGPEVQISRGGLRFTPGPDFASIFGGSGYFHQTESQVIANTTKPCMEIACPPFQDVRLEVQGVCITGSLLQRRGYPELVERFIRGALVAHTHKLNAFVIAQMVAGSTAVNMVPPQQVPTDLDAVTALLNAIEIAIEDVRYRHRLAQNATIEIVLPHWAIVNIRAAFSRRTGVAETNVTNAQIVSHFTNRGARVQWVYDWQDAYSGLAAGPGGDTALLELPCSVQFLAYPAGTWLRGSEDVIRLDTVYDSAQLATNRYTALFTEEGVLMAKVCHDSRVYTAQVAPLGATNTTVQTYTCS